MASWFWSAVPVTTTASTAAASSGVAAAGNRAAEAAPSVTTVPSCDAMRRPVPASSRSRPARGSIAPDTAWVRTPRVSGSETRTCSPAWRANWGIPMAAACAGTSNRRTSACAIIGIAIAEAATEDRSRLFLRPRNIRTPPSIMCEEKMRERRFSFREGRLFVVNVL
jgi:hypothetical protein